MKETKAEWRRNGRSVEGRSAVDGKQRGIMAAGSEGRLEAGSKKNGEKWEHVGGVWRRGVVEMELKRRSMVEKRRRMNRADFKRCQIIAASIIELRVDIAKNCSTSGFEDLKFTDLKTEVEQRTKEPSGTMTKDRNVTMIH
ncbi:hypothetical protein WN48_03686 [Eufriesea mexicana]|nr:hypothetical protein WN48_03686 [Eufriesea mexicana]